MLVPLLHSFLNTVHSLYILNEKLNQYKLDTSMVNFKEFMRLPENMWGEIPAPPGVKKPSDGQGGKSLSSNTPTEPSGAPMGQPMMMKKKMKKR